MKTDSVWKDLYQTAVTEPNHSMRRHLLKKAHTAIMALMLKYTMLGSMEETLANPQYQELVDALNLLRAIKEETRPRRDISRLD